MKKKILITVLACVLVAALAVTGTVAYLTAQTGPVVNTFSFGTLGLELTETYAQDSKIIPGGTISKTPVISVTKGSEECYVYAEIVNGFGTDANLNISTDWALVGDSSTVYRYKDTVNAVDASDNVPLTALFSTVSFSGETINSGNIETVAEKTISIDAFAYQASGVAQATADAAAIAHFAA